ncbi:MAG TPA: alpha/beta hydrolase-fold protein [Pyrinomonadaceae bacterium]|nr:alpha/beta hydrolase-fold protein [Pyrinomonadaceae bacterium]
MTHKTRGEAGATRRRAFRAFALTTIVAAGNLAEARAQAAPAHTLTGDIRTHSKFRSKHLAAERDIIVYLPPGYESNKRRRYAVFYMHDGQNLFDGATSFIPGQEWRVDETAERLIRAGQIEPLIIVGIYNAGKDRVDEYTPVRDAKHKAGGRADAYGRMLVEELKPFIDARYRTRRGAADTGLGGSSLGGLVSLHLGLRHPHVFGKLAVVSPSVWWAERAILAEVAALKRKPRLRVWVDTGTEESEEAAPDARRLRDALRAEGWREGFDLKYVEAAGAKHNEAAWAERVEPILRFLFPAQ